jgi:hypothetical protein
MDDRGFKVTVDRFLPNRIAHLALVELVEQVYSGLSDRVARELN